MLNRLGKPRVLANAYLSEYYVEQKNILKGIPFFLSAGFLGIFVVPFFGAIFFGFASASVFSIIGGIIRTFGVTWVKMELPIGDVPINWSVPFAILISLILAGIAILSWNILKIYYKFVAAGYREYLLITKANVSSLN